MQKAILDALSDPDGHVIVAALQALKKHPDPAAGARVLELLRHPLVVSHGTWDTPSAFNAGDFNGYTPLDGFDETMDALASLKYAPAIPELVKTCKNPSAYVRSKSAEALAACAIAAPTRDRADAVDALKKLLADPNVSVCLSAARGLAGLRDPAAAPVLAFALRSAVRDLVPDEYRGEHEWQFDNVVALEKLTGQDFGSSQGEEFWHLDNSDETLKKNIPILRPRIEAIVNFLKTHSYPTAGYPNLPQALSDADRALFDRGFSHWLVDPRGATRVRFITDERTAWGTTVKRTLSGWLFAAGNDTPAYILTEDQERFAVPAHYDVEDFVGDSREMLNRYLQGRFVDPSAVIAAWLYRVGHEDLAAEMLFLSRGSTDRADISLDAPDENGAWRAFSTAVHAYMVGADDDALVAAERLEKLYPTYMDKFGPGKALLGELRRRQKEGTFNHAADPLPADFDTWPVERKVARLIRDLQDVDARQEGQPGGVDLSDDQRVKKLIEIGDPAVPALIDCVESDERLTRSVHFWRDFARSRGIIGVREAALTAVMSILQTSFFEPVATGDDFSSRGEDEAKQTAHQLREYWSKYGKMPLDERMMAVLTNPLASPDAALEAALSLSNYGGKRSIGTMVWTSGGEAPSTAPFAALAHYKNPTVAEAMLAAHDRAIRQLDPQKDQYKIEETENRYAGALSKLGDLSIVPDLQKRYRAESTLKLRRQWAEVCYDLHGDGPMRELAAAFKAGKVDLSDDRDLTGFVAMLSETNADFARDALDALADKSHPSYGRACTIVQNFYSQYNDDKNIWLADRIAIRLTRPLLDNTQPLQGDYTYKDGTVSYTAPRSSGSGGSVAELYASIPPEDRLTHATLRACDDGAIDLDQRLFGAPLYHPLDRRADERLAGMRNFIDLYGLSLRRLSYQEAEALHTVWYQPVFVPAFKPLDHPAITSDVKAGRAVFDLAGKGTVVPLALPLVARLAKDHGNKDATGVLIVQAERDAQGVLHYGIIEAHAIRAVTEDQLTDIQPPATQPH